MTEETSKTGPKDVFLYIFTVIALYISIISLGSLIFNLIDFYFPDPLLYEYRSLVKGALRWPLAVITVMFPLYLWANIFNQRELVKYPVKRELKTRKWLLYLTIFIAVFVIAGDLIALIFRYLEGGLSVRFFLQVASVFLIAGSVFLYYGWNVRKEIMATQNKKMNIFVKCAVFLAAVVIVFSYFVAGLPQSERQRKFDQRRVSDLQQVQGQIVDFWRAKERLPNSLDEIRNEVRGFIPPKDPETGEPYEYRLTGELSFEFCANFKTANEDIQRPGYSYYDLPVGEFWFHTPGRNCFERTIDPEFYPPYEKDKKEPKPVD